MKIFISYSYKDDTYRKELETHLCPLKEKYGLDIWSKENIQAGENWNKKSLRKLKEADIILLLLSPDSFASDYIQDTELKKAITQRDQYKVAVVPILLRPCSWDLSKEFEHIQILPENQQAVSQWKDRDEAFVHIVKELDELMEGMMEAVEEPVIVSNPLGSLEEVVETIKKQERQQRQRNRIIIFLVSLTAIVLGILCYTFIWVVPDTTFKYRIVLMSAQMEQVVFDKEDFRQGKNNNNAIQEILRHNEDYAIDMEKTHGHWNEVNAIKRGKPDLIIIHYAAFYDVDQQKVSERSDRAFYHFMEKMEECKAQFIIYNKGFFPNAAEWKQKQIRDFPELKGRIHTLEIPHESSFKDMDVKLELERLVEKLSKNHLTLLLLDIN